MNSLLLLLKILVFVFLGLAISASLHAQTPAPASFDQANIDTVVAHTQSRSFSGTILVMQGSKEVFHYSNGTLSTTSKVSQGTATRYNIGSAGKTFTSLLIMQLVAQNKLSLDLPISNYLPASYTVPNADKITVRHLLSQTSGLGDFFDSPDFNEEKTITIDDHLKLVQRMKPANDTPGVQFHYSNSGFIVLGKILEIVYQQPFQQIVKTRILQPAGIQPDKTFPIATGYRNENNQWIIGEGNNTQYWTSAGGLFLSPLELHRIMQRVTANGYLPATYRDTMWVAASHPKGDPPFVNYALGWMVEKPFGLSLVGHNGGVRGFQMAFRYLPQSDLYIYVFSNHENGAEETFMDLIMMLIGKRQKNG